jgi:hypothetical protein
VPYFLNTRKSGNLVTYENSLLENKKNDNLTNENTFYLNNNMRTYSISPNDNQNDHKDTESNETKIRENMNNVSKILSEKLKKTVKENLNKLQYKTAQPASETQKEELENVKKLLNKIK